MPKTAARDANRIVNSKVTGMKEGQLKSGRPKDPDNPDPHVAVLRVHDAANGKQLSELKLPAEPVFDGMAAAAGRIYLSTTDGRVTCFEAK